MKNVSNSKSVKNVFKDKAHSVRNNIFMSQQWWNNSSMLFYFVPSTFPLFQNEPSFQKVGKFFLKVDDNYDCFRVLSWKKNSLCFNTGAINISSTHWFFRIRQPDVPFSISERWAINAITRHWKWKKTHFPQSPSKHLAGTGSLDA